MTDADEGERSIKNESASPREENVSPSECDVNDEFPHVSEKGKGRGFTKTKREVSEFAESRDSRLKRVRP